MNEFNPRVSIIIPVYNGSNYLREAIDSALGQSYPNREVIVVNDGSNDEGKTEKIAVSFGSAIKYMAKPNGGVSSALNTGIRAASGEYISWLSHDDVYVPRKLELQITRLAGLTEPVVLYGDYHFIDKASRVLGTHTIPDIPSERMVQDLLTSYPINGCTTLIPKACFDTTGLFNEKLRTTQDYEMWFRLAVRYKMIHIREPLIMSRIHQNQGTRTMTRQQASELGRIYLWALQTIPAETVCGTSATGAASCYAKLAFNFRMRGYHEAAELAFTFARARCEQTDGIRRLLRILTVHWNTLLPKYLSWRYWRLVVYTLLFKFKLFTLRK